MIAVDVSAYEEDTPPSVPPDVDRRRMRGARGRWPRRRREADILLHPDIGYYAGADEKYRRRVIANAERYAREQLPAIRAAFARAGLAWPSAQAASTARSPAGEASR